MVREGAGGSSYSLGSRSPSHTSFQPASLSQLGNVSSGRSTHRASALTKSSRVRPRRWKNSSLSAYGSVPRGDVEPLVLFVFLTSSSCLTFTTSGNASAPWTFRRKKVQNASAMSSPRHRAGSSLSNSRLMSTREPSTLRIWCRNRSCSPVFHPSARHLPVTGWRSTLRMTCAACLWMGKSVHSRTSRMSPMATSRRPWDGVLGESVGMLNSWGRGMGGRDGLRSFRFVSSGGGREVMIRDERVRVRGVETRARGLFILQPGERARLPC